MNEGIQTIKQANNGITAITALIDSAKALANSAKSKGVGTGYATEDLTFSGIQRGDTITMAGAGGATYTADNVDNTLTNTALAAGDTITIRGVTYTGSDTPTVDNEFDTSGDTTAVALSLLGQINNDTATHGVTAAAAANVLTLTAATGEGVLDSEITISANATKAEVAVGTGATDLKIGATEAETAINFAQKLNAAGGSFRATAVNNATVSIGSTTEDVLDASVTTNATTARLAENLLAAAGDERGTLATQYEELQSQISNLITDSSYAGTNLLVSGETLTVDFGNDHTLSIAGFNAAANVGNASATSDWATDANIDTDIATLDASLESLRIQASSLSNNLNVISVWQDFSTSKINELVAGADNLTLADMNEEGANMLMLQTRQALGTTALSLSSQAAQSVLRLF